MAALNLQIGAMHVHLDMHTICNAPSPSAIRCRSRSVVAAVKASVKMGTSVLPASRSTGNEIELVALSRSS